ncbi:hypothetical protein [Vibrio coralliirubri]|uniref:hypothetical protein n=1 Tax=Vibrio coralliirubri TaxID=1516159 RepID=UPI0006308FE4|nr:hypothetical protein [Vibrio coralliirubri]CDT20069.1 hypothetical protein VCR6J2_250060 [Vibrio coralliirubri]CDT38787.1 hypothetical protein VCR1J2_460009 [Vibrio coralliirubri]CDT79010.1 hypothetical protein VCR8J2_190808 [Vibrio coralliirubri]CDT81962.1 hypothetical protein VCR26J2_390009 [Vibrio coralliirubri]CDU13272.1 hypothetical protein VCR17J2_420009 [Vibrio coralliirubri]
MKNDKFESRYYSGVILNNNDIIAMDLERSHKALKFIKAKFHHHVKYFLKDEIAITTQQSEKYVEDSEGKWKSGYTKITMPFLTYQEYHSWFMKKLASRDEIALQDGHPDHYLNAVSESNPNLVEIIENLGEDELPWFLIGEFVDSVAVPFERDETYPADFCLRIKSSNNVVLGYATHEFKNDKHNNCNIKLTIILPEKAPDYLIKGHLNHFTIEFRNWYLAALNGNF